MMQHSQRRQSTIQSSLRRSAVLMIGGSLMLGGSLAGCDPATGGLVTGTLGLVLNQALSQVNETVAGAMADANGLVISAGGQMRMAINSAQTAYSMSLDKTMDKLDDATTKKINELTSYVNQLQTSLEPTVREIASKAQTLAAGLPFAQTDPYVGSYTPHFAAMGSPTESVRVQIDGRFEFASRNDFEPVIKTGSESLRVNVNSDQQLWFEVPRTALPSVTTGMTSADLVLEVPYEVSSWILFHERRVATYSLQLTVVQPTPGSFQLISSREIAKKDERKVKQNYPNEVNSKERDPNYVDWARPPDQDASGNIYYVDPGSVKCYETWSDGRDNVKGVRLLQTDPPTCRAWAKDGGLTRADGRIRFGIAYDEWLPLDPSIVEDPAQDLSPVRWGETISVPVATNLWQLVYVSVDGKSRQIVKPFTNGFIEVGISGNSLTITARDIEKVEW